MERFINILIIDDNKKNLLGLKEIIAGAGNNIISTNTPAEAIPILKSKEIGILLINIDSKTFEGFEVLNELREVSKNKTIYKIVITESTASGAKMVRGLNYGAVDFITKPFNPNLIRAKIDVYKALYYKDQRIGQLLSNIFPENVLEDLNTKGKFTPQRIDDGVVLFTDFVDFSMKSKKMNPLSLLNKLETYFTAFDEIMERYEMEKIKTIGDAYMALGGVTETFPNAAIRACLAALEIKNYMANEKIVATALGTEFWEIRIGIHTGPLVAGIIGKTKIDFDVWGDTVNVAARAERESTANEITITKAIEQKVNDFFETEDRGKIAIHKRGGSINMFYLKQLKTSYSLYEEGKIASREIRELCGLSSVDFSNMRIDIINRLKALLPENLIYHDLDHTLNVEKSVIRFAKLEGIENKELELLHTAALYHDAGFILQYEKNEDFAIQLAQNNLPIFGYSESEIEIVTKIIAATKSSVEPETLLEKIMCDADHDYLGRADYFHIAKRLRNEISLQGRDMTEVEWINFQLKFLEHKHRYYTDTAVNIRQQGKVARIADLKIQLFELENK